MGHGASGRMHFTLGVNLPFISPKLYSKNIKSNNTVIVRVTVNRNQLKERANL